MMSARSFSDILRMEAAMDLALFTDWAERPPCAATVPACLCLLLLIKCCLTSWTSKSISLARPWRGRRRKEKKRREWWNGHKKTRGITLPIRWINEIDQACARETWYIMEEYWVWNTQDSLRFCPKLPCRNADLRVCCSVDWKRRERSFDTKHIPKVAKISIDRIIVSVRDTQGNENTFIYLFAFS